MKPKTFVTTSRMWSLFSHFETHLKLMSSCSSTDCRSPVTALTCCGTLLWTVAGAGGSNRRGQIHSWQRKWDRNPTRLDPHPFCEKEGGSGLDWRTEGVRFSLFLFCKLWTFTVESLESCETYFTRKYRRFSGGSVETQKHSLLLVDHTSTVFQNCAALVSFVAKAGQLQKLCVNK